MSAVLFYHHLARVQRTDHYFFRNSLTVEQFRTAMTTLRERFHPLRPDEFAHYHRHGGFPKRSVLVTFDDGFRSDLAAAEVLRELDMSAIFFTLTRTLDGTFKPWYLRFANIMTTRRSEELIAPWGRCRFDDAWQRRRWLARAKEHLLSLPPTARDEVLQRLAEKVEANPMPVDDRDYDYDSPEDLRRLHELGMSVGCHTATHDNLARCNETELEREISESAATIADVIGERPKYFSYPDGRYSTAAADLARRQFALAFTTDIISLHNDPARVPRRAGDGTRNPADILSPRYVAKRLGIQAVKRAVGW